MNDLNVIEEIKTLLNDLWGAKIEDIKFELLLDKISLYVLVEDNENITTHNLEFLEVSSYYYLKDSGKERFNFDEIEKINFLELTSIDYYPNGVGKIEISSEDEDWVDQYFSNANVVLEFWNALFFIEAKTLKIDGSMFRLKTNRN